MTVRVSLHSVLSVVVLVSLVLSSSLLVEAATVRHNVRMRVTSDDMALNVSVPRQAQFDVASRTESIRDQLQAGTAACAGSPGGSVYLPLVARNASGGTVQITAPASDGTSVVAGRAFRTAAGSLDGSVSLRAATIYSGSFATAVPFQTLLDARGFQTYLVPLSAVARRDFSGCDVILVGAETGTWSGTTARTALLNSERPIVAIGDGGLNFLSAAGLLSGLTTGSGNATTVEAAQRGRAAYDFPTLLTLPADNRLALYTNANRARWLNLPTPIADGIEIGRLPGTTRYPIVQVQERFLLWGFNTGPTGMTQAGQDLFVNSLAFQGQPLQVPLRSRRFTPQPGIEQALLDDLAATSLPYLHAFAQAKEPPDDSSCSNWSNLVPHGISKLYWFWGQTVVSSVTKTFSAADPLVAACLRWMGRILPEDKVMPKVLAGHFEDWADNGNGTVNLLVRFFPDVSNSEATGILASRVVSYTARGLDTWAVVMAKTQIGPLSQLDQVRWIQEGPAPGFPDNDVARQELFVDDVQRATISGGSITYNGLDGSGLQAAVMENGAFDDTHPDFAGRVIRTRAGYEDHTTHVTGIIGGSGISSTAAGGTAFQWRGMAPGVQLASFPASEDDTADYDEAYNDLDADISNHSYSQTCMLYDEPQSNIDSIIRGDADEDGTPIPARPYHKSAGNNGFTSQWCDVDTDGDGTPDAEGVRGFFALTGVAKNQTVVGALDPGTGYRLRQGSSRGPTYDGRLKPDVMAIGRMMSTFVLPGLYGQKGGTSMATPATTGVALLALQQYDLTYGTPNPLPSTVKGLLINNATDLVNDPNDPSTYVAYGWNDPDTGQPVIYHQGPDFSTGYGVIHARRTVNAVSHKAAIEGQLDAEDEADEYTIDVLADRQELRFTLVWDDPAADAGLAENALHLANDLDLVLVDPDGGLHYPWTLAPPTPSADYGGTTADPIANANITPAFPAEDHTNNVEQVTVWTTDVNPSAWAGTWTVRVSATSLPEAPQTYSLVGEWREITLQDIYPLDAGYNLAPDMLIIPVYVRNPKLSPGGAVGRVFTDTWRVRVGDAAANTWTNAEVEAAYGPVGDLAYLVVRPPNTLGAGVLYDIEVTLLDVYQVDQRVAEAYQPIDRATRTDALFFLAEPRPPVDEMIVMDNSNSMGEAGKLDSAKNAARAFADRRQAGDMIGLAYFRTLADTLYDLTLVSVDESELTDVKNQIDAMTDQNTTALGSGMLEGKAQLDTNGDPDHQWHMVLLSDGMENVPPCWDTGPGNPYCEGQASVQSDFVPLEGCPAIQVDTVAVGPEDASWRSLLEDIAAKTCGEAYNATVDTDGGAAALDAGLAAGWDVAADSARTLDPAAPQATFLFFPVSLQNTLADIYVSIADGNTHQQRIWEEAGILAGSETIMREIDLEGGLPEATFAVNWPISTTTVGVKLYRPSGAQVNLGDPDAHRKSDATHVVYRMDAPVKGKWRLQLTATQAGSEFLAIVSANTDVTMLLDLGLTLAERVVGAVMPIYVALVDQVGPITGANVQLRIKQPDDVIAPLTMYDDGTHGDVTRNDGVYTNRYTIPLAGNYQVKARAQGVAHDGDPFLRYRLRHFRVPRVIRVAYVWSTDGGTANQYRALLQGNGLFVSLINLANVEVTNFSPYSLIVIGPDTGSEDVWGTPAKVARIQNSGRRVLGLGKGGYAFFGKLSLDIGYPNGMQFSDTQVLAVAPAHVMWAEPYDLALPLNGLATVYGGNGSSGRPVNLSQSAAERLARRPSSSIYYWLAREQTRYMLWGFDLGPAAMVDSGQELFVNSVYAVMD